MFNSKMHNGNRIRGIVFWTNNYWYWFLYSLVLLPYLPISKIGLSPLSIIGIGKKLHLTFKYWPGTGSSSALAMGLWLSWAPTCLRLEWFTWQREGACGREQLGWETAGWVETWSLPSSPHVCVCTQPPVSLPAFHSPFCCGFSPSSHLAFLGTQGWAVSAQDRYREYVGQRVEGRAGGGLCRIQVGAEGISTDMGGHKGWDPAPCPPPLSPSQQWGFKMTFY